MQLPRLHHIAAAALLACATIGANAQVATGTMTTPRMYHQASALADGRILVTGGATSPSSSILASTEVYDQSTGTFSPLPPMLIARREHAAITLKDGRVLVAGGMTPDSTGSSSAEIFDPAAGQWTAATPMNTAYYRTMAHLLADGRVMVAARDTSGHHAEIFHPDTGTFHKSGDMVETTSGHGMVVLADGRVLKMGGYTWEGKYTRNAEIWDPATNQWTSTGPMSVERKDIQPVLLPDGKVLVAGGNGLTKLYSSEIYDPATGKFSPGSDLPFAIVPETSTVLGDGTIVFTDQATLNLQQYQPSSGAWNTAGFRPYGTGGASASRLPDGGMLLTGGASSEGASSYAAVLGQDCTGKPVTLDWNSDDVHPDGGNALFYVNGTPGCRIGATNMPDWLRLEPFSRLSFSEQGSTAVLFTAGSNMTGTTRSASFYLANELVTVTQAVSTVCPSVPSVTPAEIKINAMGGTGTAVVSAAATCPWEIGALPSFVTVTSATSGKGNGSFSYSATANTGDIARTGTGLVTAQGQSRGFVFTQDAPPRCPTAPTVNLSSSTFPAAGGTISATVKAAQYCQWTVTGLPSWAKLATAGSGTGNGSFTLTAGVNKGSFLSAISKVQSSGPTASFNLYQTANPCASWYITPTSVNAPGSGASGSFIIYAPSGCSWNLTGVPSWITISSALSGSGSRSINYTIAPNNTGTNRSTSLPLSGSGPTLLFKVAQDAVVPPECITTIVNGAPVEGFLKATSCPAGARGAASYTDRYSFSGMAGQVVEITMNSSSFNTYLYLRNPAGTVVKSDNDGAGGTDARLTFELPVSGSYTIEATSYGDHATGAYTLTLRQ